MKNKELIEKINDKLKDKLDENINILDFVSFIKTLKLTNDKDIEDIVMNNSSDYVLLNLNKDYEHYEASFKALKLFAETISIVDKNLYEALNKRYDLKCDIMSGDALLTYVHEKMSQDVFIFDCLKNLFDSINTLNENIIQKNTEKK